MASGDHVNPNHSEEIITDYASGKSTPVADSIQSVLLKDAGNRGALSVIVSRSEKKVVPRLIENATASDASNTPSGVVTMTIAFQGSNGSLNGVPVDDGDTFPYTDINGLESIPYVVPSSVGASGRKRVLIQYTEKL